MQRQHGRCRDHHRRIGVRIRLVRAEELPRRLAQAVDGVDLVARPALAHLQQRAAADGAGDRMRGRAKHARAVGSVAAHAHPDDVGLDGPRLFVANAEPFRHTWSVVVEDHVCACNQPAHDLLSDLRLQVQADAFLARRGLSGRNGGGDRVVDARQSPHGVAVKRFDLDHAYPQVGKLCRA